MIDPGFERELRDLAGSVAAQWDFAPTTPRLIKYRENAVFEVALQNGARAVLRLHRPGYMDEPALRGELAWLAVLEKAGVPVPRPIATADGAYLVRLSNCDPNRFASVLTWVDGVPLGATQVPLIWSARDRYDFFRKIGCGLADLHSISDKWLPPPDFRRHAWDAEGLLGETPVWGRFWQAQALPSHVAKSLTLLRDRLALLLSALPQLDYGLIHADLVRENVLVSDGTVQFIDFDDAGFGWRMFDIATALLPNLDEPEAASIAAALVDGYRSRRALSDADLALLPMFLVLRALTYIGWAADRPEVDPAGERTRRYATRALDLAEKWENGWTPLGG